MEKSFALLLGRGPGNSAVTLLFFLRIKMPLIIVFCVKMPLIIVCMLFFLLIIVRGAFELFFLIHGPKTVQGDAKEGCCV